MKKFFLLFALLLGMTSCNNDPELDTPNPEPDPRPALSTTVPVTEALDELYGLMDDVAADTRAGAAFDRARKIRDIRVSGARAATRTGAYDLPDTLVYVVNFSDDQGFAVLGAQRSLEPVYVLTESGTFDAAKLDAAIAAAIAEKSAPSSATRTAPDPEQPVAELGTDYVYHMLADAVTAVPHIAPVDTVITYGAWKLSSSYGPHVKVKWDQTYPFNSAMPESTHWDNPYYRGRYPVGCAVIAAAQIMSTLRSPYAASGQGAVYQWTDLNTVSNYTNYENFTPQFYDSAKLSFSMRTYTNQLADFLYVLGTRAKAEYGTTGTGVTIQNMVEAFKKMDPMTYGGAKYASYATSRLLVRSNLEDRKPMYVRGSSPSGGHAWVVDGYICRKREITYEYLWGYTGPTQVSYSEEKKYFLHCNWGYQGKNDGFYAEGVFDMSRHDSFDEEIDTNPNANLKYNFNTNNQVILY